MRVFPSFCLAVALALPVGCAWMEKIKNGGGGGGGNGGGGKKPLEPVPADQLVGYLNLQASRLQTIAFEQASVTAHAGDGLKGMMSYTVRGELVASQPRYFHMTATGGLGGGKIDLGSNPDQFWMYLDVPTQKPLFVYASHADFEQNRAPIPGGLPFEPDWVMQALGMTTFPTTGPQAPRYDSRPNDRDRTHTLSWEAKTPAGMPIRKEIVFAADDADSNREQPQVRRHVIRNANNKVICSAEVKKAKTIAAGGTDPRGGHSQVVQYPTQIVLRWEEQKFEMDMRLERARVNPQLTPEQIRAEFTLPTRLGPSINLAEARFEVPNK